MKRNFLKLLPCIALLLPSSGIADTAASGTTVPLSDADKKDVLNLHNKARCDLVVYASKMPSLTWNNLLYQVAQAHANKCVFAHNADRSSQYAALGGSGYVGENIYMISGVKPGVYLTSAIKGFVSEKVNFSYMSPSDCKKSGSICGCKSGKVCGHYTQVIWDHTTTVACAQADCTNTPLKGQFVVCDYAPGGNYISTEPYISSSVYVNTAACQAVGSNQLSSILSVEASSNPDNASNILDQNPASVWAPSDSDNNPNLSLAFNRPLNIDYLTIRWSDINHAARSVQVEYSNNADGGDLKVLSTQSLAKDLNAKVDINLAEVRFLKVHFLDAYDSKVQVASLETFNK